MESREPNVVVISTAQGYGSGAESVLVELTRGWDPSRGALRVVTPRGSRVATGAGAAAAVSDLPASRDAMLPNVRALLHEIPSLRGATIVHAWHSRGFELALLAGRLLGVPATGTIHDHPECSTHGAVRRRVIRGAARRLDGLVFVSDAVAAAWRDVGVPPGSVTVHNGLAEQRARRPGGRGELRVGFLGMNAPWKGFPIAAAWAARSASLGARWHFYGDVHPVVAEQAAKLRAVSPGAIELAGRKPAAEIFDEIDLLVHASTEFDPFPTVLLEAARAGIPAVASSLGGSGEIVEEGSTGYLFSPDDPESGFARLDALLRSRDLRERMGRAARARYEERFTISRMTQGYAAFWANASR